MYRKIRSIAGVLFTALFLTASIPFGTASPAQAGVSTGSSRISHEVKAAAQQLKPGEMITVIVFMEEQAGLNQGVTAAGAKRSSLIRELKSTALRSQRGLRQALTEHIRLGKAHVEDSFWVFNGMAVTALPSVIEEIAQYPGVKTIDPNRLFSAPELDRETVQAQQNLGFISVSSVWDLGFHGEGVVVANLDTGVDGSHPDLSGSWRGGSNSWFDPYGQHLEIPSDMNGHGTWTMGIMVGGDASGSYIGVAPGAKWIAAKIFNDQGQASSIAIHQAFQWLLDPDGNPDTDDAPHVVNNSWSYLNPGCYLDFQQDLRSLRAAGILPIFAAGNSGPGDGTSVSPSNYPEALSVGAVDNFGEISLSSSRGPVACGGPSRVYPDLVAPGVGILSTGLTGGYTRSSGTSMASPHVAGTLALLLSAFPNLSVEQQEAALLSATQDLGPEGPDNSYGQGIIDAQEAYKYLSGTLIPDTGSRPSLTPRIYLPTVSISR